jgi:hypothetical protein
MVLDFEEENETYLWAESLNFLVVKCVRICVYLLSAEGSGGILDLLIDNPILRNSSHRF